MRRLPRRYIGLASASGGCDESQKQKEAAQCIATTGDVYRKGRWPDPTIE